PRGGRGALPARRAPRDEGQARRGVRLVPGGAEGRPGLRARAAAPDEVLQGPDHVKGGRPWPSLRSPWGRPCSPCSTAWSPRATGSDTQPRGADPVLYLTAFVTAAALVYLVYAMIRPECF